MKDYKELIDSIESKEQALELIDTIIADTLVIEGEKERYKKQSDELYKALISKPISTNNVELDYKDIKI